MAEPRTLSELLSEHFATRVRHRSGTTRLAYAMVARRLMSFFEPTRQLSSIAGRHAEAFIAALQPLAPGAQPLARSSVHRILVICRSIFRAAVEWGYLGSSPFDGRLGERLHGRPGQPWHHLTVRDFRRLLTVVESPSKRAFYWLQYGCGLRPAEAANLLVEQVDLDALRLVVATRAGSATRPPCTLKAERSDTGSKSRTVPIPQAAAADLAAAMLAARRSDGWLTLTAHQARLVREQWCLCRAGRPCGRQSEFVAWSTAYLLFSSRGEFRDHLEAAGIRDDAKRCTLRCLRKCFAQNHADAGTPPRTLAALLGHSDPAITLRYYVQVRDANYRDAAKTMDAILAQDLNKPADCATA